MMGEEKRNTEMCESMAVVVATSGFSRLWRGTFTARSDDKERKMHA